MRAGSCQASTDCPSLKTAVSGVGSSVSRPGEDQDPEAAVRGPGVGSSYADPLRLIPGTGKVAEYGSHCPQRPISMFSHTLRTQGSTSASWRFGVGVEQTSHVLDNDQPRAQPADGEGEVRPQPRAGAGPGAEPSAALTSRQGNPPVSTSIGSAPAQSTAVMSPRWARAGAMGEQVGGGFFSRHHTTTPPSTVARRGRARRTRRRASRSPRRLAGHGMTLLRDDAQHVADEASTDFETLVALGPSRGWRPCRGGFSDDRSVARGSPPPSWVPGSVRVPLWETTASWSHHPWRPLPAQAS